MSRGAAILNCGGARRKLVPPAGPRHGLKNEWTKGSMPPYGYVDWHNWAEAQHKHGLRQTCCVDCGLWRFPQELPCDHRQARAVGRVKGKAL